MRTCVIIPTYNESKTIGSIVSEIKKQDLDVLVIDDGSHDNTGRIASHNGAQIIQHDRNFGKGASLRRGFEYALEQGYSSIIMMDGDGQHNPQDLTRFIRAANETEAALVLGNRMGNTKSMPVARRLTNGFMSWIISIFARQAIPDSQCGFRLVRRNVLEKIKLFSLNFEIESEILIKAAKERFKIFSIPIKSIYQGEASKINPIIDALRFIKMLFKVTFQRKI